MSDTKQTTTIKFIKDPILEPFYIALEQYCFTAFEKITPDPKYSTSGKVYEKALGHYSKLSSCLEAISKSKANNKNYDSLKEYINEYNKINKQLQQTISI